MVRKPISTTTVAMCRTIITKIILVVLPLLAFLSASVQAEDAVGGGIHDDESRPLIRGAIQRDRLPDNPDHQEAQQDRSLQAICSSDSSLKQDSVWYKIELDVFAMEELKCSVGEWRDMRNFLESELDRMELFDEFQIEDLNPKLCKNPGTINLNRRELSVLEDGQRRTATATETGDDALSSFEPSDTNNSTSAEQKRQLLVPMVIWFDLFFKGGSR